MCQNVEWLDPDLKFGGDFLGVPTPKVHLPVARIELFSPFGFPGLGSHFWS